MNMDRLKVFLSEHKRLIILSVVLLAASLAAFELLYRKPVVMFSWDDKTEQNKLRREVVTAINVYTDGTETGIYHESGVLEDVKYEILRVIPSEHTFLQVDYTEEPKELNEVYDVETVSEGYAYAGGINAGFFYLTGKEYGRPVGAVRRHNEWTTWHGQENTPAYGSGFATAYFTGDQMEIRYHGWKNGEWQGDDSWDYKSGYTIDAEYGVSGSYTYYVNGVPEDITGGDKGMVNYRTFGRAATIFAQDENNHYLLIEIFGTVEEEKITEFLGSLNTVNALRMDGGISTQMVYVRKLVKEIR